MRLTTNMKSCHVSCNFSDYCNVSETITRRQRHGYCRIRTTNKMSHTLYWLALSLITSKHWHLIIS